jgi:hypothetical protein
MKAWMPPMAAALLPLWSFAQTPAEEWRVTLAVESGPHLAPSPVYRGAWHVANSRRQAVMVSG